MPAPSPVSHAEPGNSARAFIGTSGWNYRDWSDGAFYPAALKPAQWLGYYAERFGTVEINSTIRRGEYRALQEVDPALELLAGEDALDSVLLAAGATGFDATGHEVLSYEGPLGVGYGVAILHDIAVAPRSLAPDKETLWSHH